MEVIIMTLQVLLKKIDEINDRLVSQEKEPRKEWLTNEEFMKLLKISKRQAQFFRDQGLIPFSQIRHKIYYKQADIEEFLQKHYHKAFK